MFKKFFTWIKSIVLSSRTELGVAKTACRAIIYNIVNLPFLMVVKSKIKNSKLANFLACILEAIVTAFALY